MHLAEVKIIYKAEGPIGELHYRNYFIVANVYPEFTLGTVDLADKNAFIDDPAILKFGRKAFSQILRPEGKFNLIAPI